MFQLSLVCRFFFNDTATTDIDTYCHTLPLHDALPISDALDLDEGVFTWKDPRRIAASLKASAERSRRRKGSPLQSAMSMLTFYINRAGRDLDDGQGRKSTRLNSSH